MIVDHTTLADVNGEITELKDAKISLLDRGFIFGDSVYEVIGTKKKVPIFFDEHLERLSGSLKGIRLYKDGIIEKVRERSFNILKKSPLDRGILYIQISRGICPYGKRCDEPHPIEPTIAIMVYPFPQHEEENYEKGVRIITVPENRWKYCNLKTNNLIPRVLARMDAKDSGAYESLFVDEEGRVLECSSTNIFAVFKDELATPPLSERFLPGVTRRILLKEAKNIFKSVIEKDILLSQIIESDEVFITGTSTEVLSVVKIDDHMIGNGNPGKYAHILHEMMQGIIKQYVEKKVHG